jgi:hypothetical protein
MEWKKRLLNFAGQKPAHIGLRSKYALRMYGWAKKHVAVGTKRISLEQLRTVLGLDSVKDAEGNVIREGRLAAWANFRHRALNIAIAEINAKTDLNVALKSLLVLSTSSLPSFISGCDPHTNFPIPSQGAKEEQKPELDSAIIDELMKGYQRPEEYDRAWRDPGAINQAGL